MSAGQIFREALKKEKPLQLIGTINAYSALMAKGVGFRALYLSGAGVTNASYGLPDIGITTLDNVLEDTRRILSAVPNLPLIVDIDTGWGNENTIAHAIKALDHAGAAGVHIEDQVFQKRCGHLDGKQLVTTEEMVLRIKAALKAKVDKEFVIIARTDAYGVEGLQKAIERAIAYEEVGADILFLEGITQLEEYKAFRKRLKVPILANITEFGKTPLFNIEELASACVDIVLYPLSAMRAMNFAALLAMQEIRLHGTQKDVVPIMQTRDELYEYLHYLPHEKRTKS